MTRSCSIDGCDKKYYGKGYCAKHYQRVRDSGSALTEREMMAKELQKNCIPLTRGKYAIVDEEDFEKMNQWKWHCTYFGYAARREGKNGKMIFMHSEICGFEAPDHINRNKLDNRKSNLRQASESQNKMNIGKRASNTSGYIGVSFQKRSNLWHAYIGCDKKRFHIGYFKTAIEAARARDLLAKKVHGSFVSLNFPTTA